MRVARLRAWPADYDLYLARGVHRFIAEGQWDIVHCQGYHTFVAPSAMTATLRHHLPLVVTFHSGGHSSRVRRLLRPLQQLALRPLFARADRLIGVSQFETEFFRRRLHLPRERFETITNGVSTQFLEVGQDLLGEQTVICSVGRLERYKGHHRVIAALPEVRKHIPDVVLNIVGDGPYKRQLGRLAERLGVADIVRFTVVAPDARREMADLFRSARLITLLSNYESQGVVGLEALAVGRSLLVAEGTALAELGQYGDVSVIPPHVDAEALGWLIARKIQQDLVPGRAVVPIWEETVDRLTGVYRDVLRERGAELRRTSRRTTSR